MAVPVRRGVLIGAGALGLMLLVGASVWRLGPLPPLGPFLDPVNGVWAVAAAAVTPESGRTAFPGLSGPAEVLLDDRGVPHVFAGSETDLFRIQGYLVARDRLFQLELQTRATAGTLSELFGPRMLQADRAARSRGLAWSAERKLAALDTASPGYQALAAYADGVNAWIAGLTRRGFPVEYHLFGTRPAAWEPIHSLYLLSRMGLTLASEDPASARLAVQAMVGAAAAEALVPVNDPIQEPIQPNGGSPRYDLARLPPPGPPDSSAALALEAVKDLGLVSSAGDGDAMGSNNWAVAPGRTRAGYALLAGDPHLELTLPSIWYEAHLIVPGVLDVAGVSLPGFPGITIGFNRDVAWSFTNTGGDVADLYQETVDDPADPTRYRLDGEWRPLTLRVETYRGPSRKVIAIDTVRYTHRGPLAQVGGQWLSLRWTVHEPVGSPDIFLQANRTRSADEWLQVMQSYVAPTQNGLVADREGTIAIRSSGWYPIRPGDGRGDVVLDGSSSAADWTGMLPVEAWPGARNPGQGFLASANQQPVDPRVNPHYFGAEWPAPWRALRINTLLRADSSVTPEAMQRFQTDPGSARAEAFIPFLLDAARASEGRGDERIHRAAALLAEWDRTYQPDNHRAVLFELAMEEVSRRIWDELIPADHGTASESPVHIPSGSVLRQLLADPTSAWWDDRRTPDVVDTRDGVLAAALGSALDSALARHGDPSGKGWEWGRVRTANIFHLLGLPSLSALGLRVRSGPSTLAPLGGRRGTSGASWRMVVELGHEVRAWATYPGGQSGNPASGWYADRIPKWVAGDLDPVLLPRSADDIPAARVRARWTFVPMDEP
jgi:penicillin amidase